VILYCATTSAGKLREFRRAASADIEIQPLPEIGSIPVVRETGTSFEENAIQKVRHYSMWCDGLLFAEDSGLAVDSLDGAPGIYSARFAGIGANDEANNALLLKLLNGIENRTARYVCVIALADGGRIIETFRGEIEGVIAESPQGPGGFGYDPLFYFPPLGCTFAEMSSEQKLLVSHRGKAAGRMLDYITACQKPC
jgi:XTP/dITP diphosphohydrolase